MITKDPAIHLDIHLYQFTLIHLGVSHEGAQQFATGQSVVNPSDRLALADLLGWLLHTVGGGGGSDSRMHKPILPAINSRMHKPILQALQSRMHKPI